MSQQDLIIHIGANTAALTRELKTSQGRVKAFGAAIAVSGAVALFALNEFSKYETALIGVGKTTGLTGDALKKYGADIKDMSVKTGQSANELMAISQAAGQLGVTGSERLQKFTDTIAKLGTASDLSGEEAATTLTRILNVTGEGVDNIDQFASVIVRLGNNFAASESEIARMAQEVSKATAVFGIGSAKSAALGTALKSVGVQAELGGSVVGKSFRTIDAAIRNGGKELETLQLLTGMTGDELKKTFETDATLVFQKFVEGLGEVKEGGGSVADTLEIFGLKGDEVNKVLPVLAERSELLADALRQAGDEVKNTTALEAEFAAQNDTLDQNINKLYNSVINLASSFGEQLAPTVNFAAKAMTEDMEEFGEGMAAVGQIFSGVATIIAESLNFLIGKFDEFAAASLRSIAATIEQAQNLADILPFVEGSFKRSIDGINAKAEEYENAARKRMSRSKEFFIAGEQEKVDALVDGLDTQVEAELKAFEKKQKVQLEANTLKEEQEAAHQKKISEIKKEFDGQEAVRKAELAEAEFQRKIEARERELELEEEQFQEDLETLDERLTGKIALENKYTSLVDLKEAQRLADKANGTKNEAKAEKILAKAKIKAGKDMTTALIGSAVELFDKKTALGRAAVIADKANRTSEAIMFTYTGATRALAEYPAPYSYAVAAATVAAGMAQVSTIIGAQEGGLVPGIGRGDKVPYMLEPKEIIVPQEHFQTFSQLFGNFPDAPTALPAAQSGGELSISIGLSDEASQLLTIEQFEDSRIGVSR